jgi:hypothetical protein
MRKAFFRPSSVERLCAAGKTSSQQRAPRRSGNSLEPTSILACRGSVQFTSDTRRQSKRVLRGNALLIGEKVVLTSEKGKKKTLLLSEVVLVEFLCFGNFFNAF